MFPKGRKVMLRSLRESLQNKGPFVRWWILACCLIAVVSGIFIAGGAQYLSENDPTGLSWVIVSILASGSAYYGVRLFKNENLDQGVMEYLSEVCTSLGLLGTVIGLIMMISGAFGGLDIDDPSSLKTALVAMSSGIGTALTTTLVGLTSSLVLGLQKKFVEIKWA
jgi:hypothetical protein